MKDQIKILLLAIILFLTSCALMVNSKVTIFHKLPEEIQEIRYSLVPMEGQDGDLEYESYKALIKEELQKHNFKEVDYKDAELLIAFNYVLGEGSTKTGAVPIFGQTGVSSSTTVGTVTTYGNTGTYYGSTSYTPTYGITGYMPYSVRVYPRQLYLSMVTKSSLGSGNVEMVCEASVNSAGRSSNLPEVIPAMIKALFKKFPGETGKTYNVSIPISTSH